MADSSELFLLLLDMHGRFLQKCGTWRDDCVAPVISATSALGSNPALLLIKLAVCRNAMIISKCFVIGVFRCSVSVATVL